MRIAAVAVLGLFLLLVSIAIFAYGSLTQDALLQGSENGKSNNVDYLAFFGFAFGGAGFLIFLFAVWQWIGKWRLDRGVAVKGGARPSSSA